jgi:hypothetical protein
MADSFGHGTLSKAERQEIVQHLYQLPYWWSSPTAFPLRLHLRTNVDLLSLVKKLQVAEDWDYFSLWCYLLLLLSISSRYLNSSMQTTPPSDPPSPPDSLISLISAFNAIILRLKYQAEKTSQFAADDSPTSNFGGSYARHKDDALPLSELIEDHAFHTVATLTADAPSPRVESGQFARVNALASPFQSPTIMGHSTFSMSPPPTSPARLPPKSPARLPPTPAPDAGSPHADLASSSLTHQVVERASPGSESPAVSQLVRLDEARKEASRRRKSQEGIGRYRS